MNNRIKAVMLAIGLCFMSINGQVCYRCNGVGKELCPVCGGSGLQPYSILGINSFPVFDTISIICSHCHGSGYITCTLCGGSGILSNDIKTNIRVD